MAGAVQSGGKRPARPASRAKLPAKSLERVRSIEDFNSLSKTYYRGRFQGIPHLMFVIDRSNADRVYFVNSKLYSFHKDFVNATYLSLERGHVFYENNYLKQTRRFFLGTIAFQPSVDKYTYEFWEGDLITADLLIEANKALARSFFAPLWFKPNSSRQEAMAGTIQAQNNGAQEPPLFIMTATEIEREQQYLPLNPGSGVGQLRIIEKISPETIIDQNQIVIFKEAPVHLTPLSGIITTEPASPLSHTNMLAHGWRIPNAYIKNADKLFKQLEGKYVKFEARDNDYSLTPAPLEDVEERERKDVKRADLVTPSADINFSELTPLGKQHARDARRFGAKSANLGELMNSGLAAIKVPDGITVPFYYYAEFLERNKLDGRIDKAVEEDRFVHDPIFRKARLAEIRQWIQTGKHSDSFVKTLLEIVRRDFGGKGLFARSSTNSEDLPGFSGAGLYTTVPNVRGDEQLLEAIKTVWASLWNYEAYEARESYGMNHFGVYPAVLIQIGIDTDSAGVAITANPFDPNDKGAVYINAKRGLGIKVVEGKRVSEQVIYRRRANSVQVLTRSREDTMLSFDEHGGVKEIKIEENRSVLTDAMVRRLARAAFLIKQIFKNRDQDIEWGYSKGELYILQSRPYVK